MKIIGEWKCGDEYLFLDATYIDNSISCAPII